MNDENKKYDQIIDDTAQEWFADCGNLLVWDWEQTSAGPCQPSAVAFCHENRQLYPESVKKHASDFFPSLLRDEWKREGLAEAKMPVAQPVPDSKGRMVWFLDLRNHNKFDRCLIGRACMREYQLPAWDFQSKELAFPGASKTSVIYVGNYDHLCEPTIADLVHILETMQPDDPITGSFTLAFRQGGYLSMLMTMEGCIVQVRTSKDPKKIDFQHFQACSAQNATPCRIVAGGYPAAEENLLSWNLSMSLVLAYHANPNQPPEQEGIYWQDISEEFAN